MFDKNWNIIVAVLIIVLVIFYFRNCYEGFADNTEAIANVASLYNKDNFTITNLNVTGDAKFTKSSQAASNGIEFLHTNLSQGIGLGYNTIYATGSNEDVNLGLAAKGKGTIGLNGDTNINGWTTSNGITSRNPHYPLILGADTGEGSKRFVFHIPAGDRNHLILAPTDAKNKDWQWGKAFTFQNDGSFCLGGTCITENHLKMLKGEKDFFLTPTQNLANGVDQAGVKNTVWIDNWNGKLMSSDCCGDAYKTAFKVTIR